MSLCFRNCLSVLAIVASSVTFAGTVSAEGIADHVLVNDPYVRAVPPVVKTTAAFMQLQSSLDREVFLTDARTEAAGAVELHMHTADNGVMRMRRIPHIPLPPGKTVSLQPGGLHIMLFDLNNALKPGDRIPLVLVFEDGSSKEINAVVRPVQGMMQH